MSGCSLLGGASGQKHSSEAKPKIRGGSEDPRPGVACVLVRRRSESDNG